MDEHAPHAAPPRQAFLDRLIALASHPLAPGILAVLALLEATVFPGPTEAMIIALVLGRREQAWWFAGLATVASIVGALIGYHLGAAVFVEVVRPLIDSYGYTEYADSVTRVFAENAFLALGTSGFTPVPWMLYTAIAGAVGLPLPLFIAGALVGRGIKYFAIAALAYILGPRVHQLLRRYGGVAVVVVTALLVIWFLLS
jgi:membrane protein YqaA with SNARE-associated domain